MGHDARFIKAVDLAWYQDCILCGDTIQLPKGEGWIVTQTIPLNNEYLYKMMIPPEARFHFWMLLSIDCLLREQQNIPHDVLKLLTEYKNQVQIIEPNSTVTQNIESIVGPWASITLLCFLVKWMPKIYGLQSCSRRTFDQTYYLLAMEDLRHSLNGDVNLLDLKLDCFSASDSYDLKKEIKMINKGLQYKMPLYGFKHCASVVQNESKKQLEPMEVNWNRLLDKICEFIGTENRIIILMQYLELLADFMATFIEITSISFSSSSLLFCHSTKLKKCSLKLIDFARAYPSGTYTIKSLELNTDLRRQVLTGLSRHPLDGEGDELLNEKENSADLWTALDCDHVRKLGQIKGLWSIRRMMSILVGEEGNIEFDAVVGYVSEEEYSKELEKIRVAVQSI